VADELLRSNLIELWTEMGPQTDRVLLGGGYGLYLKQLHLAGQNERTLMPPTSGLNHVQPRSSICFCLLSWSATVTACNHCATHWTGSTIRSLRALSTCSFSRRYRLSKIWGPPLISWTGPGR